MPLTPAEQLAHSTVRIECTLRQGGVSTGTGFFYSLNRKGDLHVPVIITNKHVVAATTRGRLLLTLQDPSGGPDELRIFPVTGYEVATIPAHGYVIMRLPFLSHELQRLEESDSGRTYAFQPTQLRELIRALQSALQKLESTAVGAPPGPTQ
jgi:hypothetical protein